MGAPTNLCLFICIWSRYLTEYLAVHITIPPYYSYQPCGIHIRGRDWITFQVKTSSNAHLGLQTNYNSTDVMYEVVLGASENSYCLIRNSSLGFDQAEYFSSVVSGLEYRHFWVSWTGGVLTVGRGIDLGSDVMMTWTDPSPMVVNYLAVTSWYGTTGDWIFETPGPACKEHLKFTLLQKNAIYTPSNALMVTATEVTLSRADCAISCFAKPWCQGFSYGISGHKCNMFDEAPQIQDVEESEGWETLSLDQ